MNRHIKLLAFAVLGISVLTSYAATAPEPKKTKVATKKALAEPAARVPAEPALHVISIYQPTNGEVSVEVLDESRPIILALTAYSRTHWRVSMGKGVKVTKVIIDGYEPQKISGLDADTQIEIFTAIHSPCERCFRLPNFLGRTAGGEGYYHKIAPPSNGLKALTGLDVTTFQTGYSGVAFQIFPGMRNYVPPVAVIIKVNGVKYDGERCAEFEKSSVDEMFTNVLTQNAASGCSSIESAKVSCEIEKAKETWVFSKCGAPGKIIQNTSYNPALH